MKYFAYGSNMLAERLLARVKARNPTPYVLVSHRLRFHKRSSDCSGKCNIICTGQPSDVVHGVLFDVPDEEIPKLDKHEGVGCGYMKKTCRFFVGGAETDVLVYVASTDYIDDGLVPYKWYFDLVIAGAEQNGLPRDYVSALRAVPYISDPKPDRETQHEALAALEEYRRSRNKIEQTHARATSEAAPRAAPEASDT